VHQGIEEGEFFALRIRICSWTLLADSWSLWSN
jgi:hypothetical protein